MTSLVRIIFDPDATPPSIPVIGAAAALSQSTIRVSWSASTDTGGSGLAGYRIYRATSLAGTYSLIGSVSTASLSYDDTTLAAAQQRFYKVSAFDGNSNESALSSAVNATTPDQTAPSAPSGLLATANSSTQIDLTWSASTDNIGVTGYRVERSPNGTSSWSEIAQPTITSYSDTGRTASTQYFYRLRAADAAGNLSAYSSVANATTLAASTSAALFEGFEQGMRNPGDGNLWQNYGGDGAVAGVAIVAGAGPFGDSALRYQLTAATVYLDLHAHNGHQWIFLHELLQSGTWTRGAFKRMRFWTKPPANMAAAPQNYANIEFGTYYHQDSGDMTNAELGGNHGYHYCDWRPGEWNLQEIDAHPNHQRGQTNVEPASIAGFLTQPTTSTNWNMMDAFTRWYVNYPYDAPSSYPANWIFDRFEFFDVPQAEDVDSISNPCVAYITASKQLYVAWDRRLDQDPSFEVRWSPTDIYALPNGFDSATLLATTGADGLGTLVHKKTLTALDLTSLPEIWVGIRRVGATTCRVIRFTKPTNP